VNKHNDQNGLLFYQFERLATARGLSHGIFTRLGGVSSGPYRALNVGATVGDRPENVQANRERMARVLGVQDADIMTTWQVHGADVLVIRGREPQDWPPPRADAIITAEVGVPLTMRFADCVPILLYDPVRCALGLAHAGWRGTIAGVALAAVRAMHRAFGCQPRDIIAGIGPSIGPCCYEVGPEVASRVEDVFGLDAGLIRRAPGNNRNPRFDLWEANHRALHQAGVGHVEMSEMCTACNTHEFFSHRAEAGRTGRFGMLAVLRDGDGV
jgi:YfiH family protein